MPGQLAAAGRTPHSCPVHNCHYRTANKSYMRKHTSQVHGKNAINCPIEGCKGFFCKRTMKQHVERHKRELSLSQNVSAVLPETLHKCEHCEFSNKKAFLFEAHVLDYHLTGLTCPVEECNAKFTPDDISVHFGLKHSGLRYSYRLGNGIRLLDENEELVSESNLEESDLEAEFLPENALPDGFTCCHCDKKFNTRYNLIRHIARVHEKRYSNNRKAVRLPCMFDGCNKYFKCQTLLNDHLNMHNGIKPYQCESCSMEFYARARYAVHLKKYHMTSIKDIEQKVRTKVSIARVVEVDRPIIKAVTEPAPHNYNPPDRLVNSAIFAR